MALIHSSYFRPRAFPFGGTACVPSEMDRLQDITVTPTLNREKLREIGRSGTLGWLERAPSVRVALRQYEYGSMELYRKLANKNDATTSITLDDFKNSMMDICGYKTNDDGAFTGTVWYKNLRTAGFGISIPNPDAMAERTFELIGEDEILLQNDNKYFIEREFTATGGTDENFVVSDGGTTYPDPVEDPDNSGQYLLKVVRVTGNDTVELEYEASGNLGYSYNSGTQTLTVNSTTAGDIVKAYWSAGSYITGADPFVLNDVDLDGISADSASIYLQAGTYVYKLQSVGVDVTFDRTDYREIGNANVVQRGIREKTVRITLGKIVENYTVEEVLRGVAGLDYGKIDLREYRDDISLKIKFYEDNKKTTFKIGYWFTNLTPTTFDDGVPLNDYITRGVTLEGEDCTITSVDA